MVAREVIFVGLGGGGGESYRCAGKRGFRIKIISNEIFDGSEYLVKFLLIFFLV